MPKLYLFNSSVWKRIALLFVFLTGLKWLPAQPIINFVPLINTGLSAPIEVTNAGDSRLFIVEQTGRIRIYNGSLLATPFLDISDSISYGGERGLLSMTFHPSYATNGYFFVYYTDDLGDLTVTRFQAPSPGANVADELSGKILLTIPHQANTNHNGGHLQFGPDGNLYFATGDGGGQNDPANNAQNGNSLLGKMIRLNVDNFAIPPYYTIPADNPFVTDPNVRDEIWAMGLRNPFRWSFDRLNGNMWIGDVGEGSREEVNFRAAGSTGGINYGWDCIEGNLVLSPGCTVYGTYAPPILDYPHTVANGGFSITGGYVYRGNQYPSIYGYYIFADYISANVWLLPPGGTAADTILFRGLRDSISSFGESSTGELYATTLNGRLFQITASINAPTPVELTSFTGVQKNNFIELTWQTQNEVNVQQYEVEYSTNGVDFGQVGTIKAKDSRTYRFNHNATTSSVAYYRLRILDIDGKFEYSKIIQVNSSLRQDENFVKPSVITNKVLNLYLQESFNHVQLVSMEGKVLWKQDINGRTGNIRHSVPGLTTGSYLVRLIGSKKTLTQKILVR